MTKKYIYILSYCFSLSACFQELKVNAMTIADSCTFQISGIVLDADTEEPIPFATVTIKNTVRGTIADQDGKFLLDNLCEGEYTLECTCIGRKPVTHHHDVHHKDPVIYMATNTSELESVVIEGKEIKGDVQSLSLSSIDKSALLMQTTNSLAAAIDEIQGVTFISTGSNVQLPVIHGLYGNRILIINNGVKHGFQNWGTDHAPEIDITSADQITVLKGATGVRFGPEALGGVVLVEGHPLDLTKSLHGTINTGYQTNGRGYHINGNLGAGNDKISYNLSGNFQKIGDRQAPDYSLTNTGMEEKSINAGFRYHLPQWDIKTYYSYITQNLGLLRASIAHSPEKLARSIAAPRPLDEYILDFSYDINEPRQNTVHHLATFTVDWFTDLGKFSLLLSQQVNQRKEYDVRRNADRPIINLQLNTTDSRLLWYHPTTKGLQGILGLQYFSQNNDNNPGTSTTPFIPNYNTHRFSVFLIESLQKGKNTFELGLRVDHEYNSVRGRETSQEIFRNEFSFTNITASVGFVRDLSSSWQLRSNLGSAWRPPNMAELYSFGQHGFKVQYGLWRYILENGWPNTERVLTQSDKPTKSERGYKWTNELSYDKNGHALALTAYSQYIDNYTFDRPIGLTRTWIGPMPMFIYDQADALFIGVDLTYSYSLTDNLKGVFGGSYLWSKTIEKNQPLINQPPVRINADFSWKTPTFLGLQSSKLTLQTSYTLEQFLAPSTIGLGQLAANEVQITSETEIFDIKDAPTGYFLAHLKWDWKLNKLGGQLEVRNVFNTAYRDYLNQMRYFADEPGRNILLTINYKF